MREIFTFKTLRRSSIYPCVDVEVQSSQRAGQTPAANPSIRRPLDGDEATVESQPQRNTVLERDACHKRGVERKAVEGVLADDIMSPPQNG